MTRTETARGAAGAVIAGQRIELLDRARIYACGITPYDVTHPGHAATFVWIDTLGRVLRLLGVQPEVCRNVTDVDDVLDAAAGRAGAAYDEFAAIQQFGFDQDMAAIGVRSPEHEPRAHRYVTHVIRLASGLLATGAAYQRAGGVYFRGGAWPSGPGWTGPRRGTCPGSSAGGRTTRPRTTRWMWPCGRPASPATRPGTPRGAPGAPGGTPSAWPWPCRCSGRPWTSTLAAPNCGSRITPTTPRWPRRSPACARTRGPGSTPGWSRSTAPRWPSRPGTWCCSTTCWPSIPPGRCG